MSGLRKVLLAFGVALGATGLAHADIIELTDASRVKGVAGAKPDDGVTAITNAGLDASCQGPFMGHADRTCIRGRFILPQAGANGVRDFAAEYGDARKFFKFEVHSPQAPPGQRWITAKDALKTEACHWTWVAATKHEIDSIDDIYWLISDRGSRYPANLAMPALAWAIDPDGKMGIWDTQIAIPSIPSTANEGVVSNFLITTGRKPPAVRQAERDAWVDQQRASGSKGYNSLDPLNVQITPDQAMTMLVEEIARTRADMFPEFGEVRDGSGAVTDPVGVRKASRVVAVWMCETLSNAIRDKDQGDRVGRIHENPAPWVHDFAYTARRTLITFIERADPATLDKHFHKDRALGYAAPGDPVALNDLDVADAALDILYHPNKPGDPEGQESGVWSARKEDVIRLVDALVACASASPLIDGAHAGLIPAQGAKTPTTRILDIQQQHEALANRALDALSTLPNSRPANAPPPGSGIDPGAAYREAIESAINKNTPESPKANAARTALVHAGLGTPGEAQAAIERLFSLAIAARPTGANGANPGREQAILAIVGLQRRLTTGDVGPAAQKAIADRIADLKSRQASGAGDAQEKAVLDLYTKLANK